MFSTLRNRFGIPGVISVIALVFAMFGGAYAASNTSGGGKATASAKAKQGPRGKTGKTGPAGPAGAQGPAGPAGPAGAPGAAGEEGATGPTGKTGPAGANGVDGATGATGPEGSPWTVGGTLPAGETETGTWGMGTVSAAAIVPFNPVYVPISFSIPLAAPFDNAGCAEADRDPCQAHYIRANGKEFDEFLHELVTSSKCTGSVAAPSALPGNLCIYAGFEEKTDNVFNTQITVPSSELVSSAGAGKSGALLLVTPAEGGAHSLGTWAVTAP